MILILSTPRDLDTQKVIDWLTYKKALFFRLNDEDLMDGSVEFKYTPQEKDNSYFKHNGNTYYIKDFRVVWCRKFGFLKSYEDVLGTKNDLIKYLYSEFKVLSLIILNLLNDKKWLFKRLNMPTKLKVLEVAIECGLNIPETLITSNKETLTAFFNKNQNTLISKSLGEGKNIDFEGNIYPLFTQKIESINSISNKFSPSLFQKYIDKKYELRIFFIDGDFYSMVIFSQNNPKTVNDFRNYDMEKPNRYEPYNLPKEIEIKLKILMERLGLNTGSIDMIKALDDKYYFLEINPSGQFGMTALPCNYPLYERISEYLILNSN